MATTVGTADAAPGPGEIRLSSPAGRWVIFTAVLGSSMALIDSTVVNVALPRMGEDLHASVAGLQWTVTAYTLTLAAFLLLGGSLGDRFGRRRIFLIGAAWFTVCSVLCALAPNIGLLVGARALQGVGAAMLTPGSLALISASLHPDDQGRAIGTWAGLGGASTALAPLLGGWLVQALSWRWVFWINVPFAVLVIFVALRHVPESRNPEAAQSIDYRGAALTAVGLGGLTYALIAAGEHNGAAPVVVAGVLGLLAIVGFVVVERRESDPMVPLSIFKSRLFSTVNISTFFVYGGLSMLLWLLVLVLQQTAGYSPAEAGTATLPFTLMMLLFSARSGALGQRIGPRIQMTVGPVLSGIGALMLTRIGANSPYATVVLPGVLVLGAGMVLTVAPLTSAALGSVPRGEAGIASGINNAVARTASLVAIAIAPLVAGLTGSEYTNPGKVGSAFDTSARLSAVLFFISAVIAAALVRRPAPTPATRPGEPPVQPPPRQCPVSAPSLTAEPVRDRVREPARS